MNQVNAKRLIDLLVFESKLKDELYKRAGDERKKGEHKNEPITDGVVHEARYLDCSPKMLWILKEPWEKDIETGGGGWSVTKDLIPEMIQEKSIKSHHTYAPMAWITYAVLNGFLTWQQMQQITDDPGEALLDVAYVNVSKYPGKSVSKSFSLKQCYSQNRAILAHQLEAIAPDIVIFGSTCWLFLEDLKLKPTDFTAGKSEKICHKDGRLYIDALHPAQRGGPEWYVDNIVAAVKPYRQNWGPADVPAHPALPV
jgi:hypothetical protein